MHRLPRTSALFAALALVAALAAASSAGAAGPTAQASKHCSTGSGRGLGPTYAFQLSVSHTSCRNGRKLIRAYNSCRHHHGGADGHCGGVYGYHCSEHRFNNSRFQFDARVKCSKGGGRRINHTYTQNL
jgi:opacity protein-like surface antigen